jgi:wyosine [tRNA(Phe)-imidazoG37] synthetase (radical SAM superfamily)
VYLVLSQRARGLSIGINLSPGKRCNFQCVYCEVDRGGASGDLKVDVPRLEAELEAMLRRVASNRVRELPGFGNLPAEMLVLREVALSGDGEPTLSPQFREVVRGVVAMRARSWLPFFKVVLITNTTGLPRPEVREGLRLLGRDDEIWAKLEAGTQAYMDRVNVPDLKLREVMGNILGMALERPVVIQSLFPLIRGAEPPEDEITEYVHRLQELKAAGAQISLVQVYSAHRPPHLPDCGHLPLASLSKIARRVRTEAGLRAEVF